LIIRQAVECGVKYIVPIAGEFSQKQNIDAMEVSKKERFERIIREARQQSGSPVATEILPVVTTDRACDLWKKQQDARGIVLYERNKDTQSLHSVFADSSIKKAAVVVGSEGGISPSEIELLSAGNFVPVHFDVNILRCETASLYGMAAVQSALLENTIWQLKE
ncbi:MAG: RNA methyltransferase, partial [Treponema sp.]|nr:RNA methyltransferase [Treponema sp.]